MDDRDIRNILRKVDSSTFVLIWNDFCYSTNRAEEDIVCSNIRRIFNTLYKDLDAYEVALRFRNKPMWNPQHKWIRVDKQGFIHSYNHFRLLHLEESEIQALIEWLAKEDRLVKYKLAKEYDPQIKDLAHKIEDVLKLSDLGKFSYHIITDKKDGKLVAAITLEQS